MVKAVAVIPITPDVFLDWDNAAPACREMLRRKLAEMGCSKNLRYYGPFYSPPDFLSDQPAMYVFRAMAETE